jgi:putative sigma-54 modulation protein
MKASIDLIADKLERQVTRYRQKRRSHRGKEQAPEQSVPVELDDGHAPVIVKTKQFALRPMSPEEAVLELELVGHDFFLFRNVETGEINVVYRRHDAGYGLIEPS